MFAFRPSLFILPLLASAFPGGMDAQQHQATFTITTVAGNGTAGYVPAQDGGLATRAQLDEPYGTAVDAAGDLYIADRANHRIRRVDASTGIITTVAGTGVPGYFAAQEGGQAVKAQLNGPRAVALDRSGNLYIADTHNHRIRRVDAATQRISTVAGNGSAGYNLSDEGAPATRAALNTPSGIALDAAGNLYIADYDNSRIRKVAAATGVMTTIAGNGISGYIASQDGAAAASARLNKPRGVTVDSAGNLYIADYNNSRIRKIAASAGLYLAAK